VNIGHALLVVARCVVASRSEILRVATYDEQDPKSCVSWKLPSLKEHQY